MPDTFSVLRSTKRFMASVLGDAWEVRLDDEPGTFTAPYCRIERATPLSVSGSAWMAENSLTLSIICYPGEADSVELGQQAAHATEELIWRAFRRGGGTLTGPRDVAGIATAAPQGALAAGSHSYAITSCARRGESVPSATGTAPVVITAPTQNAANITWSPVHAAIAYFVYRDGFLLANVPVETTHYLDDGRHVTHPHKAVPVTATARVGGPMVVPLYDYEGIGLDVPVTDDTGRDFYSFARVRDLSIRVLADPIEPRQVATVATVRLAWLRSGQDAESFPVHLQTATIRLHFE